MIVRPDEPNIGRFPNEDSQSLVFGDDNLFKVSKFSGWDRIEGGTRANVGLQYSAHSIKPDILTLWSGNRITWVV